MNILKDRFVILIIVLGFLIRIFFASLPGFKIDVDLWFFWAERLVSTGFANFYTGNVFTTYPPGFLYLFGILGVMKNFFNIDNSSFYFMLKLPFMIVDIIIAVFVYRLLLKQSIGWARIALSFLMFNPATIFNSAIWGQLDSLLLLIIVLSVFALSQKKIILSSILFGTGLLFKPQAVALAPVFGVYLIRDFSLSKLFRITIPALVVIILLSLPFFPNQPLLGFFQLSFNLSSYYEYTSLFAYNFWGGVGFWIPDSFKFLRLSFQNWGFILYGTFWLLVILLNKKKLSLYTLAALATLSFFFLPTRVHERYLYPAFTFLIIITSQMKSKILLVLTIFLSLIHLLNLYYVYVYFNEFYLNLPKILYNPFIYNFLETNGREISIVSTAIFVFISLILVKYANDTEKN